LFVIIKILLQKILKKEDPEDGKHNEKLDYNYYPDLPAPLGHIPESVKIEQEEPVK
jgi:hypothetical protein